MPESPYDRWKTTDHNEPLTDETLCEVGGEWIDADASYIKCADCGLVVCRACASDHADEHEERWRAEHPEDGVDQNGADT